MCFSIDLWSLFLEQPKIAFLAQNGEIGRKMAIFWCSRNKSHKSILKHMVQNRYYHGLKAYMSAFHRPERGPVYAPTRHTRSTNVENFGQNLGTFCPILGDSRFFRPHVCLLGAYINTGVCPRPKLGSHIGCFSKTFSSLNSNLIKS